MFGFKKKTSLENYDDNKVKTTFRGPLTINGMPIGDFNDGKDHTIEVADGQIIIDNEDKTQETISTLRDTSERVEDCFEQDTNVYFENLVIKVDKCETVEAEAPNVKVEMPTASTPETFNPTIRCNIHAADSISINGDCLGDLYADSSIDITGNFKGHIKAGDDVNIDGSFDAQESNNQPICKIGGNLDVSGNFTGKVIADGSVDIYNADTVVGKITAGDDVNISAIKTANISVDIISNDGSVDIDCS